MCSPANWLEWLRGSVFRGLRVSVVTRSCVAEFLWCEVSVLRCRRGAVSEGSDVREFYCSGVRVLRGFSVGVLTRKRGKDVTLDSVADSCRSVKTARGKRGSPTVMSCH